MKEYFKETLGYQVHYFNQGGPSEEKGALAKRVDYDRRSNGDYFVLFYDSGPHIHNPVNPFYKDAIYDGNQSFIWKKVSKADFELYITFIQSGKALYKRIQDLFTARY